MCKRDCLMTAGGDIDTNYKQQYMCTQDAPTCTAHAHIRLNNNDDE